MPDDYYVSQYSGEEIDALLGGAGEGTVRYDAAQTLTDAQKTQARANIAAAPDGFGLGKVNGILITDGNNAVLGGDYVWGSITTNLPFTYGCMNVVVRGSGSLIQTAYSEAYPGCSAQRKCTDGTWGEWEWVNPPMQLGGRDADGNPINEYRTTERYLGKPVYVMVVDCGVAPNNNESWIQLNKEISRFISIDAVLYVDDTYQTTIPDLGGSCKAVLLTSSESPYIVVKTTTDSFAVNGYHIYVRIKYTKSTD